MAETSVEAAAAEAAPSARDSERETLTSGERIIAKFHPHPISFIRWYLPSLLLMVWTSSYLLVLLLMPGIVTWLAQNLGSLAPLAPLVLWAVGAIVLGAFMPRNPRTARENVTAATFLKAVHFLYLILVILPLVLFGLMVAQNRTADLSPWIYIYVVALTALMILLYDLYRRSFTYFITNYRVIFRYKFFKTAENNLRFSQVRDVEVDRTFLQRMFKLGNVRPYTGAEENLVDLTPGYSSPDECFFGVRNPEYVKRLILEQMLGPTDRINDSVYRTQAPRAQAAPAAGGAAPAGDSERMRRLEAELEQLRREKAGQAPSPPPGRAQGEAPPRSASGAAPSAGAPTGERSKLSDVTPTVGVREPQREHAGFGDDRDAFASSDAGYRSAPKSEKKPGPPGTPAEEDDKPRSI